MSPTLVHLTSSPEMHVRVVHGRLFRVCGLCARWGGHATTQHYENEAQSLQSTTSHHDPPSQCVRFEAFPDLILSNLSELRRLNHQSNRCRFPPSRFPPCLAIFRASPKESALIISRSSRSEATPVMIDMTLIVSPNAGS